MTAPSNAAETMSIAIVSRKAFRKLDVKSRSQLASHTL